MNILIISDAYPPEIRSASHLMQELAEELRNRGHNVTVVTTYPQYNLPSQTAKIDYPILTIGKNISILRIKTLPHHNVNFLIRGLSHLTLPFLFKLKIKKYIKKRMDVAIVHSPPLTLAYVAEWLKRKFNTRYIFGVQDIFPQNAIDLGIMENRIIIKLFEAIEMRAYRMADRITVNSEGNKKFLVEQKNVAAQKITVAQHWIDTRPFIKADNNNYFRKKYNLQDKFIFLFAGVIGPSQHLDLVVHSARELQEKKDIVFLLVGDGTEKKRLVNWVRHNGIKNVIFESFVPKEEYPALVKESNVGIVCISSKNKTPVVPAKILGYLAAARPVVAFINKESDVHLLIEKAQCGYSTISDNQQNVTETILKIYRDRDKLDRLGMNGFHFLNENLSRSVCVDEIEKLFYS